MNAAVRFLVAILLALLAGCAGKPVPDVVSQVSTSVEVILPQRAHLLPEVVFDGPQLASEAVVVSDQPLLHPAEQAAMHERFLERFFAPWKLKKTSLTPEQAFWGVKGLGSKQGYAENLQPFPPQRWSQLVALQGMESFPSMNYPAIVTRNTAMRVLPSVRPFFLDPTKPGEGFPFDYFQNSALWLGTPVLVCHVSKDRGWYFVETAFANGWVRVEDVALAGHDFCEAYETRVMAALVRDDVPLLEGGRLLGQTHIGAIFPLHSRAGGVLQVKVPLRDANGWAKTGLAAVPQADAAVMPLPLTSRTVARLADAMAGQLYGWGGMFENRDCSSTLRDLFLPFGVWLPRNSSQQAQHGGRLVSLEGLTPDAKLDVIRRQGMPFASFISMPGHIGLYLGTDGRGEPLMLHNMWGVRTTLPDGSAGRAVAGQLVISTLRPGENRPDVRRGAFLERIRGLTILESGLSVTK